MSKRLVRVALAVSLLAAIVSLSAQTLPGPLFKREPAAPQASPVMPSEVFDIAVTLDRSTPGPYQLLPGTRRSTGYVATVHVRDITSSRNLGRFGMAIDPAVTNEERFRSGDYEILFVVDFDGAKAQVHTEVSVTKLSRLVARQRSTMRFTERVR